jgi:hypothetical protein
VKKFGKKRTAKIGPGAKVKSLQDSEEEQTGELEDKAAA